jgi:hypothetical protein
MECNRVALLLHFENPIRNLNAAGRGDIERYAARNPFAVQLQ